MKRSKKLFFRSVVCFVITIMCMCGVITGTQYALAQDSTTVAETAAEVDTNISAKTAEFSSPTNTLSYASEPELRKIIEFEVEKQQVTSTMPGNKPKK